MVDFQDDRMFGFYSDDMKWNPAIVFFSSKFMTENHWLQAYYLLAVSAIWNFVWVYKIMIGKTENKNLAHEYYRL
jgi:hypothetical protein